MFRKGREREGKGRDRGKEAKKEEGRGRESEERRVGIIREKEKDRILENCLYLCNKTSPGKNLKVKTANCLQLQQHGWVPRSNNNNNSKKL